MGHSDRKTLWRVRKLLSCFIGCVPSISKTTIQRAYLVMCRWGCGVRKKWTLLRGQALSIRQRTSIRISISHAVNWRRCSIVCLVHQVWAAVWRGLVMSAGRQTVVPFAMQHQLGGSMVIRMVPSGHTPTLRAAKLPQWWPEDWIVRRVEEASLIRMFPLHIGRIAIFSLHLPTYNRKTDSALLSNPFFLLENQ